MIAIFEVKKEISAEMGLDSHIGKLTGHATAGAPLYRRFCIGCHPSLGDGEGENAMWIDPKPRNFALGIFKCRSTPSGTLPTDEDLFATHRSWVPPEPEVTAQRIKAGQATFKQVECWKCHGVEGRGNGPSADTLTDDLNRPIKPFNFHDTDRFKCGSTDHDLYKIFMTRLDGTPRPSFMDNLKPDDAWNPRVLSANFAAHAH
jgi:cytochrome c2